MPKVPAKIALLHQLACDNINVIFGNPGTLEESLLDALADVPEITYVMGLQESVVVAMADGYARVTHRPAVAQVHSAVGLGNAMAMLYQAHRSFTPLVVLAGETYSDLHAFDGLLGGDVTQIARPVTKWSARVSGGSQLLRMLRRALKVAMTPPQGPVFLALPMDVLDEIIEDDVHVTSFVDWHCSPPPDFVRGVAQALLASETPMMLIGDGVSLANAQSEVKALSEFVGCPVYGVDFADLSAAFTDPLFQGLVGQNFGDDTREITLVADVVLVVGSPLFPEVFPSQKPYFQKGARVFQIDMSPWEIAKNYPVAAGVLADPKLALTAILAELESRASAQVQAKCSARRAYWEGQKQQARQRREAAYQAARDTSPMSPSRMMETIVASLPDNVLIYDESVTAKDELLHYLQPARPDSYFLGRGGCVGVGWPGAIGAKLACPQRPVLALSGDGSCLYVIQALWTAAHHKLDMVFVVCNNRSYRILKLNMLRYWSEHELPARELPHMDICDPYVEYDKIAEGFGVQGWRATTPTELECAVRSAFSEGGTHLIEVLVDGSVAEDTHRLIRSQ